MNSVNTTREGKRLSYLLRHAPASEKFPRSSAGWVPVEIVRKRLGVSFERLRLVVEQDSKGRFEFSEDGSTLRARQGHSVPVSLEWEKKTPPAALYHGTTKTALQSILAQGLLPMSRHAVHLTASASLAKVTAARRKTPTVLLAIAAEEMTRDGYSFTCSPNGVWLISAVPAKYISIVGL